MGCSAASNWGMWVNLWRCVQPLRSRTHQSALDLKVTCAIQTGDMLGVAFQKRKNLQHKALEFAMGAGLQLNVLFNTGRPITQACTEKLAVLLDAAEMGSQRLQQLNLALQSCRVGKIISQFLECQLLQLTLCLVKRRGSSGDASHCLQHCNPRSITLACCWHLVARAALRCTQMAAGRACNKQTVKCRGCQSRGKQILGGDVSRHGRSVAVFDKTDTTPVCSCRARCSCPSGTQPATAASTLQQQHCGQLSPVSPSSRAPLQWQHCRRGPVRVSCQLVVFSCCSVLPWAVLRRSAAPCSCVCMRLTCWLQLLVLSSPCARWQRRCCLRPLRVFWSSSSTATSLSSPPSTRTASSACGTATSAQGASSRQPLLLVLQLQYIFSSSPLLVLCRRSSSLRKTVRPASASPASLASSLPRRWELRSASCSSSRTGILSAFLQSSSRASFASSSVSARARLRRSSLSGHCFSPLCLDMSSAHGLLLCWTPLHSVCTSQRP
eukprot:m.172161 g.172161  ORF g.172161 m.172161 type:complete len:496 (-) comp10395_c0_seq23:1745-3232(-)